MSYFRDLMQKIKTAVDAGTLTADQINAALNNVGLKPEEMARVISEPLLCATIDGYLSALLPPAPPATYVGDSDESPPLSDLEELLATIKAENRAQNDLNAACRDGAPEPVRRAFAKVLNDARVDLTRLKESLRTKFMCSRGLSLPAYSGPFHSFAALIADYKIPAGGWKPTPGEKELMDHTITYCETFLNAADEQVILAHTQVPWENCVAVAVKYGLIVERLPFSLIYTEDNNKRIAVLFARPRT